MRIGLVNNLHHGSCGDIKRLLVLFKPVPELHPGCGNVTILWPQIPNIASSIIYLRCSLKMKYPQRFVEPPGRHGGHLSVPSLPLPDQARAILFFSLLGFRTVVGVSRNLILSENNRILIRTQTKPRFGFESGVCAVPDVVAFMASCNCI